MKVNFYLQNQFEQILKKELKLLEDETDDVNVLNCVPRSIERVCLYHKIIVSRKIIDVFVDIFCKDQECFPWTMCEGYNEFKKYFDEVDAQTPVKRLFEQFKKPTPFKPGKFMQINEYEDIDADYEATKIKLLGVIVTRDFKNAQCISALGFWKNENCSLIRSSNLKYEETCLVATVPNSKNNTFFITSEKGVCSIASVDAKTGSFIKLPVEFILDIPEESIIESFNCRRCSNEGDLILFWECSSRTSKANKEGERQSFYTGINEAVLTGTRTNVERLFRAVHEEDLEFITFTKPILFVANGKIFDEEENVLTKHNLGRAYADCTSSSAHNEKHELIVLSQSLSFVPDESIMKIKWFCDGKTGYLEEKVKEIVSLSIF